MRSGAKPKRERLVRRRDTLEPSAPRSHSLEWSLPHERVPLVQWSAWTNFDRSVACWLSLCCTL